jgi:hypothetical protein
MREDPFTPRGEAATAHVRDSYLRRHVGPRSLPRMAPSPLSCCGCCLIWRSRTAVPHLAPAICSRSAARPRSIPAAVLPEPPARPLLPCTLGSIPTAARSQRHARQARRIRRGGKCGDGVVGLGLRPSSSHAGLSATFSRHAGHHRRRRVDPGWLCPDPAWHTGIRQARDGFDVSVDPAGCVRYDVPRDEAIVRVVTRYFFFI